MSTETHETLSPEVMIDPVLIREHFIRLPADLAYANAEYAEAYGKYLRADAAFDREAAQVSMEWRESLHDVGVKATVDMVKEKVLTDPRYIAAKDRVIEAEIDMRKIRGRVDAIIAKKDMLVSLGAHIRAEMTDPSTRSASAFANDTTG